MKTDLYTRVVLTVIALCLLWMSVGGPLLITPVQARGGQSVVIAGWLNQSGEERNFEKSPLPVATR
jgi:hypothetical protein